MISTLKTLFAGANARMEESIRDNFAVELIDQKIREAENGIRLAKSTLAGLIQRQRSEQHLLEALEERTETMLTRAREALDEGREELATEAADAIAQMENEQTLRRATLERIDLQVTRLHASVEAGHRRIVELKQGAITAKAIKREQSIHSRLNSTPASTSAADEAQELINRVVGQNDPFEQSQILDEINASLNQTDLEDRMAGAVSGQKKSRATANEVLARLKGDK